MKHLLWTSPARLCHQCWCWMFLLCCSLMFFFLVTVLYHWYWLCILAMLACLFLLSIWTLMRFKVEWQYAKARRGSETKSTLKNKFIENKNYIEIGCLSADQRFKIITQKNYQKKTFFFLQYKKWITSKKCLCMLDVIVPRWWRWLHKGH